MEEDLVLARMRTDQIKKQKLFNSCVFKYNSMQLISEINFV